MRFLSFLLIAVCFVGTASPAFAQLASTEPLTISISPQYPRPHDQVTVTVGSNLVNLAASAISISVNGETVSEGSRTALVRIGGAGETTTIRATATTNGQTYTAVRTIRPSEVSLVVEPATSAHLLYEGGKLVAPEARVRIVALADLRTSTGARIPSAQLAYTWKLGDKVLNQQSGLGKSVLDATAPVRYRDAQVSVTVATQDNSQSARSSVYVSPATPLVRLYRMDPLSGIDFAHALSDTYTLSGSEESFLAVPYFFKGTPSVEWTLNGNVSSRENTITVRTTGNQTGTALVSAKASDNAFETGEARFTLQFGNQNTNFFGF